MKKRKKKGEGGKVYVGQFPACAAALWILYLGSIIDVYVKMLVRSLPPMMGEGCLWECLPTIGKAML